MNTMLFAAVAGFLWMEIYTVNVSRKKRDEAFDPWYYLKHNWTLMLGNGIGTYMMFLCSPLVIVALKYFASKFIEDPATVELLTDSLLAPVAGALIGMLGARFVRWVFGKGNTKLKPDA